MSSAFLRYRKITDVYARRTSVTLWRALRGSQRCLSHVAPHTELSSVLADDGREENGPSEEEELRLLAEPFLEHGLLLRLSRRKDSLPLGHQRLESGLDLRKSGVDLLESHVDLK